MTAKEAKEILSVYRPWADAEDPAFAEALALTREDKELHKWFEAHCATQTAMQARLQEIAIPAGLEEQILSEHRARRKVVWLRQPATLAAAAILVILGSVAVLWNLQPSGGGEDLTLAGYRNRVVRTAVRSYSMDLETNDVPAIRSYLAQHQAHSDFHAPPALEQTAAVGCGVLRWQGHRVTMVCYRSGQTLAPGQKTDLLLFVVDRNALPDPPPDNKPVVSSVGNHATASWSEGDKTYVLAGAGDEAFLRRYF